MNLIMTSTHIITCRITTITTEIILLVALTTIIVLMVSEGVVWIWEIFKEKKQMQEAKMKICKWIKFRDKYDKPNKSNNRIK